MSVNPDLSTQAKDVIFSHNSKTFYHPSTFFDDTVANEISQQKH